MPRLLACLLMLAALSGCLGAERPTTGAREEPPPAEPHWQRILSANWSGRLMAVHADDGLEYSFPAHPKCHPLTHSVLCPDRRPQGDGSDLGWRHDGTLRLVVNVTWDTSGDAPDRLRLALWDSRSQSHPITGGGTYPYIVEEVEGAPLLSLDVADHEAFRTGSSEWVTVALSEPGYTLELPYQGTYTWYRYVEP